MTTEMPAAPHMDGASTDTAIAAPDADSGAVEPRELSIEDKRPVCLTTFVLQPPMRAGATMTAYRQILTKTMCVPCAGCPTLVTSTALMGYGPAGRFKTTLTLPYGYTTVYKCL